MAFKVEKEKGKFEKKTHHVKVFGSDSQISVDHFDCQIERFLDVIVTHQQQKQLRTVSFLFKFKQVEECQKSMLNHE